MKTTLYIGDGSSAVTFDDADGKVRLGIEFYEDGVQEAGCWTELTHAEARHVMEALQDELGLPMGQVR